jgi:hypothetical protein
MIILGGWVTIYVLSCPVLSCIVLYVLETGLYCIAVPFMLDVLWWDEQISMTTDYAVLL